MNAYELKKINSNEINENELNNILNNYLVKEKEILINLSKEEIINYISSHLNFFDYRLNYENEKFDVEVGDICFIDYGINYTRECGYFHFGIIIEIKHSKCLIIPMTSNPKTFEKATFWKQENLLAIPIIRNVDMNIERNATLFLNDARFINSSRIINKIANINKNSSEFIHIKKTFYDYLQKEDIK